MVIDLGTGTGRAIVRAARRAPDTLVIGIDPDAAAMRDASRAAAKAERHRGLANAIFIAAPAEALPGPLAGRADVVTIALPWGSLLRGLLRADTDLLGRIIALLKPRGGVELLLSTVETDGLSVLMRDEQDAAALALAYEEAGLFVGECRPADATDVARLSSGWGRRLGIPERRAGWVFRFGNDPEGSGVTAPTTEEALESGVK